MEIKDNLVDYIRVWDDIFPKETLINFRKVLDVTEKFEDASIVNGGEATVNKKHRDTLVWHPSNLKGSITEAHWTNLLSWAFKKLYEDYFQELKINHGVKMTELQILKYGNNGHYKFHVDASTVLHRTLSLIFFVNDDYKGGALKFKNIITNNEVEIEKKANRCIIWPSNFMYPHTVTPVTEGTRYSVVSWAL
jgi:predicted 2-oxoglutarate/Fe(II)-dependent dioxygenase YbiX|tara:strand:- start:142 stop:720 length:579 start_codon:yes stop_codon:yes gene_type:complete